MANDDLNVRVTEAIEAQLLLLLPAEDIRLKVDQVIDQYFSPIKGYNGETRPSKFGQLVEEHISNTIKDVLKDIYSSPNWKITVGADAEAAIGEVLQKMLKIDPAILQNAMSKAIAFQAASSFAYNLSASISTIQNIDYNLRAQLQTAIQSSIRF